MANLYNAPQEPDEISRFLLQILLRSSSSSSSSFMRHHSFAGPSDNLLGLAESQEHKVVAGPGRISVPHPLNSSSGCSFTAGAVAGNVSSSSVGKSDYEPDDQYECQSEEAVEAVVEETVPKTTLSRNSSKRSRAAEVHNMSEKRRRSRINEKMKALQNLIPNSNKTDKASMLDEAIEYLKQLQLQVQMLTMRNGLSLYPICLPGMVQPSHNPQTRMDIYDADKFLNANMPKPISIDQNISAEALLRLQNNCVKQAPLSDFSTMIGTKTSFKQESSKQDHFGPFELSIFYKEKLLPCQPMNEDCPQSSSIGAKAASSIPFEKRTSHLKESTLEGCIDRGDHLLQNFVNNPIFSSQLNM